MTQANWNFPTPVFFGANRSQEIALACQQLHLHKPLLIIDNALLSFPFTQTIIEQLSKAHGDASTFIDFKANPDEKDIDKGCTAFIQHQCDGVIALGGGASLDVGKTIALIAKQNCGLWDLEDIGDNYLRANVDKIVPIIAIPTTAGTGSEVGRASVIVDSQQQTKRLIFHPKMLPSLVILDPTLTLSVPPGITASTGMDALAHNMEAYFSPAFHPMADGIALEGMRIIKENLLTVYQQGDNLEARAQMLVASTMGAAAFQKGLGMVHSLSHPVGARYNKHHGLLNALFMPYVLAFNRDHINDKAIKLARFLALPKPTVNGLISWCVELNQQLSLPLTLKAIGIDDQHADIIAKQAHADPSTQSNPRPLSIADCKTVFCHAIEGTSI